MSAGVAVRRNWPLVMPVLAAVPGLVLRFSALWVTLRDGLSGRGLQADR